MAPSDPTTGEDNRKGKAGCGVMSECRWRASFQMGARLEVVLLHD
jgi:hypothetical protein